MQQELTTEEQSNSSAGLLDRVYSTEKSVRMEAQREVLDGRVTDIETLIAILAKENKKKPLRFAIGVIIVYIPIIALSVLTHAGGMAGSFTMVAMGAGAAFAPTRLQKRAARQLAETEDIRAVGPLAEALDRQDGATKKAAINALIRLLPRMKYSDRDLITDQQRKHLYAGFAACGAEYTRRLVLALEQIGDGKAVKYVQKLSEGKGVAKKNPDIAVDAQRVLPILQQREAEEHERDTLLRAAGPSEIAADELLRPAMGTGEADNELLLRPAG